ncbi:4Fe-4S binding protein [Thermoplasma sp.]|uniref:4Fe-4S binding protein n=1 Tax=Thermoplasma sp. TaxID=1973142 RepID=UPI00262AC691|nr:4Fe-4S binding protein [Thermoplasma sp.]
MNILIDLGIELSMSLFFFYLFYRMAKKTTSGVLEIFLEAMMLSMFAGLTIYYQWPITFLTASAAVDSPMVIMGVAAVWAYSKRYSTITLTRYPAFITLLIANEVLMAYFLMIVTYPNLSGYGSFYVLSHAISSYLFVLSMEIEMILSIIFLETDRIKRIIFSGIAFSGMFNPFILPGRIFPIYGTVYIAIIMVVFMAILFEFIALKFDTMNHFRITIITIFFGLMAFSSLGLFLSLILNSHIFLIIFGISMLAQMAFYFHYLFAPDKSKGSIGWSNNRYHMFYVLLFSFVAEWFISATLDSILGGVHGVQAFLNSFGTGTGAGIVQSIFNVILIFGSVTNSYVFLIIMGIEMASLVIIRIGRLRWREKRWNLTFALIAYALYTVYFPNFVDPKYYETIPLWGNIGSLGPVYPDILAALIGSYALYAVLALLFGRRSYCSTLCPSAVMYGGTLGQAMIKYNYSAPASRKHIGSKFKESLYPVIGSSWILILIAAYLSYLSSTGSHNFDLFGVDPAILYSVAVWNVLWYVFFMSIPIVGMSPCRRYGWCTTGTFVGFFSKIGFFRLKVHDPSQCVRCETKACVTACEVGAGDLAGQFIKQGYFKSSKCVGSGSCVLACPYDNIYFYDVRNAMHDFIKKFRKK